MQAFNCYANKKTNGEISASSLTNKGFGALRFASRTFIILPSAKNLPLRMEDITQTSKSFHDQSSGVKKVAVKFVFHSNLKESRLGAWSGVPSPRVANAEELTAP